MKKSRVIASFTALAIALNIGGFLGNPEPIYADTTGTGVFATISTISKDGGYEQTPYEQEFQLKTETGKNYVEVNSEVKKQTMLGVGGAMTDAAAFNISKLTPEEQNEIYEAYYGETGARYAITRSHIGSADFSVTSYSYCDTSKADPNLENFSIDGDRERLLPSIKKIYEYNPDVKFFSSIWAAPAWMKRSNKRMGGIALGGVWTNTTQRDNILEKYYQSYADYLVRYIQEYEKEGIDVYSISMQNESQNRAAWECGTWTTAQAIKFIGNYLGPTMRNNEIDAKLVIWDWDKGSDTLHHDGFINYNKAILSNIKAAQYVDGIAFHWYAADLQHAIQGKPMWSEDFNNLDTIKKLYPNIHLYATEACQENGPWMGSFVPADRYIHDILTDFDHGAECWIDWNLVLDKDGGPTHDPITNQCHAPIMLDANNKICYQPSYYILKKISRAVQPGVTALQVNSDLSNNDSKKTTIVDRFAVMDDDENITVLLGNTKDSEKTIRLLDGEKEMSVTLPAHSLTTVTYNNANVIEEKDFVTADIHVGYLQQDGSYDVRTEEIVYERGSDEGVQDLWNYVEGGYLYAGIYADDSFAQPCAEYDDTASQFDVYIKAIPNSYLYSRFCVFYQAGTKITRQAYSIAPIDSESYSSYGIFMGDERVEADALYDTINCVTNKGTSVIDMNGPAVKAELQGYPGTFMCIQIYGEGSEYTEAGSRTICPYYITLDGILVRSSLVRTFTVTEEQKASTFEEPTQVIYERVAAADEPLTVDMMETLNLE